MQSIVRFIVTNRSFTLLAFIIVIIAAWIKLPDIRVSQYPVVELPTLMIYVSLPGASAAEIEHRVIRLVENKLRNIRNLDTVITDIYNGYAWVTVSYDYGIDVDDEYVEINARINNIKPELPAGTEVQVQKRSPVDFIVSFVLGVTSETATRDELLMVSDSLADALRGVKLIEDVEEHHPEQNILIDLNLARMQDARLDIGVVEQSIRGNNQYLPTGELVVGDKSVSLLAFGSGYRNLDEIRDTMLINRDGKALALKEIATVALSDRRGSTTARIDGDLAILLTMKLSAAANIFDARRQIQAAIGSVSMPSDVEVKWLFDAEAGVDYKLDQLTTNILQGLGILVVVLLLGVGYRSAFIIASMLPAALFLSLIGLAFTEYGIQEISLAGFIIALGMIVDNGIVVTENAYKLNHYGGDSHEEAAIISTSSVIAPLVSSTATTALAFAPLFLLTSPAGLFMHSLVAVIWLCLAASLVAAFIMSSVMIARMGTESEVSFLPRLPNFMVALIPLRDGPYRHTLSYGIRHPFVLLLVVLALLALAGFAASRLPVIIFPDSEDPYFTVDIEAPADRSSEFVAGLTREVVTSVTAHQDVAECTSIQGGSFPLVNTGASRVPVRRNNAQLFCSVSYRDAHRMRELVRSLNTELEQFAARANVRASAFVVGSEAAISDVEVHLKGPRINALRDVAIALEDHLRRTGLEGAGTIDNDVSSRYYALRVDFEKRIASALGVDRRSVDQALMLLAFGKEVEVLRAPDGREYPIVLRTEAYSEDPFNVFDRIFVEGRGGSQIPLSQVVSLTFSEDEFDITHHRFKPRVVIDINGVEGYPVETLTRDVRDAVSRFDLPAGVTVTFEGQLAEQGASFGGMGKYVGIVGLAVLAILAFQFGSLVQPLVICAAIPLSFVGAFFLLYLTSQPMSFLAFIGLTSLMGIVINNSILLVDEGNQVRNANPDMSLVEVAITSGVNRFMPIILTSVTSIAGLIPLAMGDTMFKALAIVVIGGLVTSTFLTLVCLPVLYVYTTRRSAHT